MTDTPDTDPARPSTFEQPTVKVINSSKCRRELTVDIQDYQKDYGTGPGRDKRGRPLQPLLVTRWLEQGANEVSEAFLTKCRETNAYTDGLFTKRILRLEAIKPPLVGESVPLTPETIEDLSQLKESYAKKLIKDCKDPHVLRTWIDQEYRATIRTALRKRWAELVPAESMGIEDPEAV